MNRVDLNSRTKDSRKCTERKRDKLVRVFHESNVKLASKFQRFKSRFNSMERDQSAQTKHTHHHCGAVSRTQTNISCGKETERMIPLTGIRFKRTMFHNFLRTNKRSNDTSIPTDIQPLRAGKVDDAILHDGTLVIVNETSLIPLPMEPIPWDLSMKNELTPRGYRSPTIESITVYSQTVIYLADRSALSTERLCECSDVTQSLPIPVLLPVDHLNSGVSTPNSEGAIAANSTTNDEKSFANASRYGSDTVVTSAMIGTVKENSSVQRSVNFNSQCQAPKKKENNACLRDSTNGKLPNQSSSVRSSTRKIKIAGAQAI